MTRLEHLIEVLSERADDCDLLALLGTSREVRLYNAALARELRDVVEALRREVEGRNVVSGPGDGANLALRESHTVDPNQSWPIASMR